MKKKLRLFSIVALSMFALITVVSAVSVTTHVSINSTGDERGDTKATVFNSSDITWQLNNIRLANPMDLKGSADLRRTGILNSHSIASMNITIAQNAYTVFSGWGNISSSDQSKRLFVRFKSTQNGGEADATVKGN